MKDFAPPKGIEANAEKARAARAAKKEAERIAREALRATRQREREEDRIRAEREKPPKKKVSDGFVIGLFTIIGFCISPVIGLLVLIACVLIVIANTLKSSA